MYNVLNWREFYAIFTFSLLLKDHKAPASKKKKQTNWADILSGKQWNRWKTYSWSICSSVLTCIFELLTGNGGGSGLVYVWNSESTKWQSPSTFPNVSHTTLLSVRNPWSVTSWNNSFWKKISNGNTKLWIREWGEVGYSETTKGQSEPRQANLCLRAFRHDTF